MLVQTTRLSPATVLPLVVRAGNDLGWPSSLAQGQMPIVILGDCRSLNTSFSLHYSEALGSLAMTMKRMLTYSGKFGVENG